MFANEKDCRQYPYSTEGGISKSSLITLYGSCGFTGETLEDVFAFAIANLQPSVKNTAAFTEAMATGTISGDAPMGFSSTAFPDRVEITHNLGDVDSYSVSAISDSVTEQTTTVVQHANSFNLYQFSGGAYNGTGKVRIQVAF